MMPAPRHLAPRLVERAAGLSARRPRTVLAVTLLLVVLSAAMAAWRLELRTSNLDLVDPRLPPVAAFRAFADEFGTPNVLVVALSGDDEKALEKATRRVGGPLRAAPGVRAVLDHLDYDQETLDDLGLDEFLTSYDHRMFFVLVQPEDPRSSAETIAPFVSGVRTALESLDLEAEGIRAGVTGLPQYAIDDRDVIQRDLARLSPLSFGAVLLLFVFGFHQLRRPLLVMMAVLAAVVVTLGVISVVPGHLTLLSAFFASILFGLGADFGIHAVTRTEELVAEGLHEQEAVGRALGSLAPALATAAATTAGVFFAMAWCGFRGFEELGFIAGVGVLLSLAATATVLPALLVIARSRRPASPSQSAMRPWRRVARLVTRPSVALVATAAALLAVVAMLRTGGAGFDSDYLNLQPRDSATAALERQMVDRSDLSPQFAAFVTESQDEALDLTDRLLADETVGEVHSAADIEGMVDADGEPIRLPDAYRRSLISDRGRWALYAYPEGDAWDPAVRDEFLEHMRAIDPAVTGMPFLGAYMVARSQRAMAITAASAAAILLLVVGLDFRSVGLAAAAITPSLLTVAALQALMELFGIAWNPIDVMAVPIILGIGIDDGVHLVHRFLAEQGDIRRAVAATGRSIVLTSATTFAAFGAVAFTAHRGLRSFALVTMIGVAAALFFSLTVLPGILSLLRRRAADGSTAGAHGDDTVPLTPSQELYRQ